MICLKKSNNVIYQRIKIRSGQLFDWEILFENIRYNLFILICRFSTLFDFLRWIMSNYSFDSFRFNFFFQFKSPLFICFDSFKDTDLIDLIWPRIKSQKALFTQAYIKMNILIGLDLKSQVETNNYSMFFVHVK